MIFINGIFIRYWDYLSVNQRLMKIINQNCRVRIADIIYIKIKVFKILQYIEMKIKLSNLLGFIEK